MLRPHVTCHPRVRGISGAAAGFASSHQLVTMETSYKPEVTWKLFNNGKICNQGCLPSTFSKWVHHGLVDGLPAIVVVRMCLLSSDNRWMTQINSGNYFFISLKLFVKNILISSKSSLNASMTSGQHSQSLRLGRNYRISFCLLNIFKKRNSLQRPKSDMQNTA